ncbi:outer membrane efflux protein [Acidocella sp. MX-AZ02]|nr:efflux transporter outer membrane subunit [Acidocella sp. MX-AZ03]EKN00528.1 outer membrane efflux protein [Acidocella sp. MX-AZ02]WBO61114.1 efflux transporter outer membrane subunit [Acidocella sp. MX-AZ03]
MHLRRGLTGSALSLGLLAALSGCMLGPNYQAPHANAPTAFLNDAPASSAPYVSGGAVDPQWWNSFNDPVLTALETRAVQQNLDLQIATQRLFEAQAQAQIQGAALYPNLGANASYSRNVVSPNSPLGQFSQFGKDFAAVTQPYNLYQYGLQTMFDLDLWGKNKRLVEAAVAKARASEEARRAALLNVEAQVASNYIQLRGTEAVLGITQKNLDFANQLVKLTAERQQAGLTTSLDVANARATAAQISAQIPTLIAQRDGLINQIGLLLGQTPDGLPQDLLTPAPVPLTPPSVPVGLPAELLTRRPDMREAADTLHAATAQIGAAKAAFFPDISLTASASLEGMTLNAMDSWKSLTYGFGPTVTLPLFEGGQLRGALKLSEAKQKEAAIAYAKTALTAFTQVNTALVNYEQEHATQQALQEDVHQSQIALSLAEEQYKEGLVDYLTVLTTQQTNLAAQQNQAVSLQKLGTDLVTLYQALGGGWEGMYPAASGS